MYKHILIPTDGSATADKAVEAGIELARDANAKLTLFTAVPEYKAPSEGEIVGHHVVSFREYERTSKEKAEAILNSAAERARAAGLQCDTAFAQSDHPYRAIIEAAESRGCDLILMSSHGRSGLSELWYGSETHNVLTHSRIPTLVYR
ncbi:MAG TPA: universal stress protein [Burkholderiales bacterium]